MTEQKKPGSFSAANHSSRMDRTMFIVSIVALVILVRLLIPVVPEAFSLQFNPYALISLAGLLLDLTLFIILVRRPSHSDSILWFALFIGVGVLWSGSEMLERMATTPVGAAYWGDIISGVTVYLPACFYLFVSSYLNRSRFSTPFWVPATIIGISGAMASLLSGNNVFELPIASARTPWGYISPTSLASVLFIIWAGVLTISAIGRLLVFFHRSTSRNDRNQSMIFIISASAVLIVSALTEIFLPLFGFHSIPPLGVLSNAFLAISVIIGIYKFGSFSVGVEEIAETVLSTMAGGVLVTDTSYRVTYCNNKAKNLLQVLGPRLIGSDLMADFGQSFEPLRAKWEADLKQHDTANIEDVQIRHPEHPVTVSLRVTPLQAAQPGYIFVINDISELKKAGDDIKDKSAKLEISNKDYRQSQMAMLNLLEDSRELEKELKLEKAGIERKVAERTNELQTERESLEVIINGVNFGIYMLGPDLSITLVNKPMQELFAQIHNEPYSLEAFDKDLQSQSDYQNDIKEAIMTRRAVRRSEFSHGNRILRSFHSPIFDHSSREPKLLGIINVIEDITEAKSIERSRDEFFSIASHELRTPLTAIRGNTSMMMEYFGEQLNDPSLKEMVGDIHDSSIRLINIVNDFLNTSRLEQGKIKFNIVAFALPDLVNEVIEEFKVSSPDNKIPIVARMGEVPETMADRDRLKEVLLNLIGNSIKFTETGTITVSVEEEGERLKLEVTDTGRGIPVESQGLLFHKFQQASNNILTRDTTQSTGLGLYISKLIITDMGGEIFLKESAADEGATFTVMLPSIKTKKTQALLSKVIS